MPQTDCCWGRWWSQALHAKWLTGSVAQVHQHFFCCRLDMAVDDSRGGQGLTVSEVGLLS